MRRYCSDKQQIRTRPRWGISSDYVALVETTGLEPAACCRRGRQSYTSTVAGCGGFAAMVSDAIFGQCCAPCREVTNIDDIRPGDMMIEFTDDGYLTHVSIICSVSKNSQGRTVFSTCDGNMNSDADSRNGTVKWPAKGSTKRMSPNEFGTIYRVWTRYPN